MNAHLSSEKINQFNLIRNSLKERLLSRQEIVEKIHRAISSSFNISGVNIYLTDSGGTITLTYPEDTPWPLPPVEKEWLIKRTKSLLLKKNPEEPADHIYISDRALFFFSDKAQLERDRKFYNYDCNDGLYLVMISEDNSILGILFINDWLNKNYLGEKFELDDLIRHLIAIKSDGALALDNLFIHQKIESLLSDKRELKQRLQKDEEDLKRRILELNLLYETSNLLGYSLNYSDSVTFLMDSLYKVLHFDVCSVFLLNFIPDGEIITRLNTPISHKLLTTIHGNLSVALMPFINRKVNPDTMKVTLQTQFSESGETESRGSTISAFANVPLIFKEEVIGMLNVCSLTKDTFSHNEKTFLHTMANQLSSHLGRIKMTKALEKSKISSMIQSMAEGVVMFDENHQLEIINPAAVTILNLQDLLPVTSETIISEFKKNGLYQLYEGAIKTGDSAFNNEFNLDDKILSVNITPILTNENEKVGTVIVCHDITEIQKSNRIKTQRLEVINKVNIIIKSISDLESLLEILMDLYIGFTGADLGSIQLKEGNTYQTVVHSNFPDKVRRTYRLNSGETISEYVSRTREILFIKDYPHSRQVKRNPKVLIDYYLCIPITVKNKMIGIINLAHRRNPNKPLYHITRDDIDTLSTITLLSGTSIHNAYLYQETLKKEKLEQELKVAYTIQTKLLPEKLPSLPSCQFGAISIPAREIGGDYYDFFYLGDHHIGIIIADIVGKGIPAGLFMATLKSILYTHITHFNSPSEALSKINTILYNDPVINRFVPTFYGILDTDALTFRYSNAGHEPPLLIPNVRESVSIRLDSGGFPLGAFERSDYEEKSVSLNDKSVLLLFTDGVIDARNATLEAYGVTRLQEAIKMNRNAKAPVLVEKIYNDIKTFSQNTPSQDDLTIVAVKIDKSAKEKADLPLKTKEIRVTSEKKYVKTIRDEVETMATELGFNESDIYNLKLAINEAQANVIEHAYSSSEKGNIIFRFAMYRDRMEIIIKDFGSGLKQKPIKGEKHLDELEGSGLGVFLIKTVMDKVEYKRTSKVGTELIMTKFIKNKKGGKGESNGNY